MQKVAAGQQESHNVGLLLPLPFQVSAERLRRFAYAGPDVRIDVDLTFCYSCDAGRADLCNFGELFERGLLLHAPFRFRLGKISLSGIAWQNGRIS